MAKTRVEYTFDPFDLVGIDKSQIPKDVQSEILDAVSNLTLETVLSDVKSTRSPVTGRTFAGLSPDYAKVKKRKGGQPIPNLRLEGDLLGSLTIKKKRGELTLTVGDDQMGKADGHNNFSGDSKLPERNFIPDADRDQTFRPAIRGAMEDVIRGILDREGIDVG